MTHNLCFVKKKKKTLKKNIQFMLQLILQTQKLPRVNPISLVCAYFNYFCLSKCLGILFCLCDQEKAQRKEVPRETAWDWKYQESSENENENVCISSWNMFSPLSQRHRGGPEFTSNTFGLPCSQTLEFSYIEPNREENLKISGNWYFALGRTEWGITT